MITAAKGIGNGFPIGAVLIAPHIKAKHGMLGTTFGGNYLACAAALAVIDVMENEQLMPHAAAMGEWLSGELRAVKGVEAVSGRGLMLGLRFNHPVAALRKLLLEEK